jgi:hypothetical protein
MKTSDVFFYSLVFFKFLIGFFVFVVGVSTGNMDYVLFGGGHAFVAAPMWLLLK